MIKLTELGGSAIYLNPDIFEKIRCAADTHLLLTNGHTYVVRESAFEVSRLIAEWRRHCALPR